MNKWYIIVFLMLWPFFLLASSSSSNKPCKAFPIDTRTIGKLQLSSLTYILEGNKAVLTGKACPLKYHTNLLRKAYTVDVADYYNDNLKVAEQDINNLLQKANVKKGQIVVLDYPYKAGTSDKVLMFAGAVASFLKGYEMVIYMKGDWNIDDVYALTSGLQRYRPSNEIAFVLQNIADGKKPIDIGSLIAWSSLHPNFRGFWIDVPVIPNNISILTQQAAIMHYRYFSLIIPNDKQAFNFYTLLKGSDFNPAYFGLGFGKQVSKEMKTIVIKAVENLRKKHDTCFILDRKSIPAEYINHLQQQEKVELHKKTIVFGDCT